MKTITVVRNKGMYGRVRKAQILADRESVGEVAAGSRVTVEIPEDTEELFAKMDWGKSEPFPAGTLVDGDTIYMNVRFTLNPLRSMGILPIPIRFEREAR